VDHRLCLYGKKLPIKKVLGNAMRLSAKNILIYVPFILAVLFSAIGCQTVSKGTSSSWGAYRNLQYEQINDGGWLTVFLNLKESSSPQVSLHISAVEIQAGNTWLPLSTETLKLDAEQIGAGQIFIARNMLHSGEFGKLRLSLSKASIKEGTLEKPLSLEDSVVEIELPASIDLSKGDSKSLFVIWDVQASLASPNSFKAAMTASIQSIPILKDLSFVACPELDTVYVVRTDKNWVISSIGVQGEPTYLGVDTERNRLYILARDINSILVYDLNTNAIIDKYFIAMDNKPSFMFLSPDKQSAYLLDEIGKGIAKVNLLQGIIETKVTLTFQPDYGLYIEDQGRLALSAPDTNMIYLLNPDNLLVVQSIAVGNYPQGLAYFQNLIIVAEGISNKITSYSLVDGKQQNTENVGFSPSRLLIRNNQLYSTNLLSNSVTVMFPNQLNVVNEIRVGGKPLEIIATQDRFNIYVGNDDMGGLTIIDSASNFVIGFVDLAASPLGLAIYD
jgi:YVTN family beta-propeller protein